MASMASRRRSAPPPHAGALEHRERHEREQSLGDRGLDHDRGAEMAAPELGQHRGGVVLEVTGGQRRPARRCRARDRRRHLPVVERAGALAADPFQQGSESRLVNPRSGCSSVSQELPRGGPAIEAAAVLVEGRSQWFSEGKPSAASRRPGRSAASNGRCPYRACAASHAATAPGTAAVPGPSSGIGGTSAAGPPRCR
jgi:hypothetical protein